MLKNIGLRIEEFILACLILLQVLSFLQLLPGDIDYIKNIVSWTAMAYLLYRVSLTRVFFGDRIKELDLAIIFSYFLLIVKDFIFYASIVIEETRFLRDFYQATINNSILIETYSFYIGSILIILLSLYIALKFRIKKPSLMGSLGENGLPVGWSKIKRFLEVFIILIGFFIIVFNLMIEWLTMAVDAPLLVFGIFFYVFIVVGRVHRFKAETFLYKIGKFGEGFYSKFIEMFHSKNKLMLVISGILILHLLTDIGNFIIPYIIGIRDTLYFNQLGIAEHLSIYTLIKADFTLVTAFADKFSLVWIYILNVIAILFLLLMPGFIWYAIYKQKGFNIPRFLLALFYASVICLILSPVFGIRPISKTRLVGVDIWTVNILSSPPGLDLISIVLISVLIGSLVYIGCTSHFLKKRIEALAIVVSLFFSGLYIYYFFIDTYIYYVGMIRFLTSTSQFFLASYFIIFSAIVLIFYVSAFIIYLAETAKGFKYVD